MNAVNSPPGKNLLNIEQWRNPNLGEASSSDSEDYNSQLFYYLCVNNLYFKSGICVLVVCD